MNLPTISVSQLNTYVKKVFDSDLMFASVLVTGEISNFSPHSRTGHLYFSLKDASASVKAVMFAREASHLRFRPENGMKVIAAGRVTVFERDGVYQIYVRELLPDGAGALAVAYEQLKRRLEEKGLFQQSHKKALPEYPQRIGVITSSGGAALQDILNILKRRYPLCEVVLAGVTVQGPTAAGEMICALKEMNRLRCADVIILGRGGGSAEDLWCFNDESLAWAIYESEIPVISAVGHEKDVSISDLVSDLRAPTPSAAAELAVPDIEDLQYRVAGMTQKLFSDFSALLASKRQYLALLAARRDFKNGDGFFDGENGRVAELKLRLIHAYQNAIVRNTGSYNNAEKKLLPAMQNYLHAQRILLSGTAASLERLNPLSVLLRGYALVQSGQEVKTDVEEFTVGEQITVSLKNGSLTAEVQAIHRREQDGRKNDI